LVNEGLYNLTGLPQSEFIGKLPADLPDYVKHVIDLSTLDFDTLADKQIEHIVPQITYKVEGVLPGRYIERNVFPVKDQGDDLSGWVLFIRDITEEISAREAQELIGETLVHDLRAPVSSVISALEMIQDAYMIGDPTGLVSPSLQIARRSAQRVLSMIESLLEIARLQSGNLQLDFTQVEIRSLVDQSISEFSLQSNEYGIKLINEIPADLTPVEIDRGKILRVLNNLIDNALKFSPEGEAILINAKVLSGERVKVTISDSGPGIPQEYRKRIFERFTQVPGQPGRRRGSGLGLTYCKLAIEAHKGEICVNSRREGGSEFSFIIPIRHL
jgi:signal transduction histidine kinase